MEEWSIIRLYNDYVFKEFDCDDSDLNEFLLSDSKNYLSQFMSVTYLIEKGDDLVAYFSVSNDKVSAEDLPSNSQWRKFQRVLPHSKRGLKSFPAVKIGRLAVSSKYKGQSWGAKMMDYIKFLFLEGNKTGCRFILVDAYKTSAAFYEKQGFSRLSVEKDNSKTVLMYFDLAALLN